MALHMPLYLFGHSREFHDVESLIISRCTLINVHNHGGSPTATEHTLEKAGQLALTKWDVVALGSGKHTKVIQIQATSPKVIQATINTLKVIWAAQLI